LAFLIEAPLLRRFINIFYNMKLKRLSPEDFDKLAATTRLQPLARELAREVLVDRHTLTETAARAGITKQRVLLAVNVIEKAYFAAAAGYMGWVSAELELPEAIALRLDEFAQAMKANPDESQLRKSADVVSTALENAIAMLRAKP
jgi:hypothetical protein